MFLLAFFPTSLLLVAYIPITVAANLQQCRIPKSPGSEVKMPWCGVRKTAGWTVKLQLADIPDTQVPVRDGATNFHRMLGAATAFVGGTSSKERPWLMMVGVVNEGG